MNEVHLEIIHFDEYIFRKDYKTIHWAKFDVDFLSHPDFFDLTAEELKVYIHFICIASKMRSPNIRMNLKHTAHHLKVKSASIISAVSKLEDKRWKSLGANGSVRIPTESVEKRANITEQNEHNTTNITEAYCSSMPKASMSQTKQTLSFSEFFPKESISENWVRLYSQEYIHREKLKLETWLTANPRKNKRSEKGWVQFLSNWYERGWQGHLKQGINKLTKKKETTEEYIERLKREYDENGVKICNTQNL